MNVNNEYVDKNYAELLCICFVSVDDVRSASMDLPHIERKTAQNGYLRLARIPPIYSRPTMTEILLNNFGTVYKVIFARFAAGFIARFVHPI